MYLHTGVPYNIRKPNKTAASVGTSPHFPRVRPPLRSLTKNNHLGSTLLKKNHTLMKKNYTLMKKNHVLMKKNHPLMKRDSHGESLMKKNHPLMKTNHPAIDEKTIPLMKRNHAPVDEKKPSLMKTNHVDKKKTAPKSQVSGTDKEALECECCDSETG